ncbi:MAG: glucose-6-phosphate isomerase family protein [Bacillota bacterium]
MESWAHPEDRQLLPVPLCGMPLLIDCTRKPALVHGTSAGNRPPLLARDGKYPKELEPSQVRTVADLSDVLTSEDKRSLDGCLVAYWIYRGLCCPQHEHLFNQLSLRFDITILEPMRLGSQFNKTYGHYHAEAAPGVTYPEVYQVLYGTALYLLQKPVQGRPDVVSDFVAVPANQGDIVVVPPGYGHVTVNVGNGPLVMANLVETHFLSHYAPFRELAGAAYYAKLSQSSDLCDAKPSSLTLAGSLVNLAPNLRYHRIPEPRWLTPLELAREAGLSLLLNGLVTGRNQSLYSRCCSHPELFSFLVSPHLYF